MSREDDMDSLRKILGVPEQKAPEPTPFANNVSATLTKALASMRTAGMIEVEEANMEGLSREVSDAILESSSMKRLPLRIVKTLINSELVEEVFGTDAEIEAALRPFLDEM